MTFTLKQQTEAANVPGLILFSDENVKVEKIFLLLLLLYCQKSHIFVIVVIVAVAVVAFVAVVVFERKLLKWHLDAAAFGSFCPHWKSKKEKEIDQKQDLLEEISTRSFWRPSLADKSIRNVSNSLHLLWGVGVYEFAFLLVSVDEVWLMWYYLRACMGVFEVITTWPQDKPLARFIIRVWLFLNVYLG